MNTIIEKTFNSALNALGGAAVLLGLAAVDIALVKCVVSMATR